MNRATRDAIDHLAADARSGASEMVRDPSSVQGFNEAAKRAIIILQVQGAETVTGRFIVADTFGVTVRANGQEVIVPQCLVAKVTCPWPC